MFYFDHAATTVPSDDIINVASEVARQYFANPSSAHRLGVEANNLLNSARKQMADILNFNKDEIFFMSSGTEVNNFVFQGVLPTLAANKTGNKILISTIEHPSISNQLTHLQNLGFCVDFIPVDDQGVINLEILEEKINSQVVLISTMAVNNEVGSVQPLKEIAEILYHFPQIIWHVDGIQSVTTQLELLNIQRIDLLSLSSHKFHSVRGLGILAKRERVSYRPLLFGGGQERNLRSSTENLPAIVASSRALRIAQANQHETKLKLKGFRNDIIQTFKEHHWQVYAVESGSEHIVCASLSPVPGEVLLHAFEEEEIYVSTTSACSSRVKTEHATLHAMGVANNHSKSAIRISMSNLTKEKEVVYLMNSIHKITDRFK